MLQELSIKNFALIKEAKINFQNNLNIITGETGSGKSILLGSVNLCLGKRFSKDMMRDENDETQVSVVFYVDDEIVLKKLNEMDIVVEDNKVIIYRRITKDKNISKINDISCTLNKIKEVTNLLLDVYGQHDSEDLRRNAKHLEFLDSYIGKDINILRNELKNKLQQLYEVREKEKALNIDESQRLREIDLLNYEINELLEADLKMGEEEVLASEYKKLSNAKDIIDSLVAVKNILSECNIGMAVKEIKSILKYDDSLSDVSRSLIDCESLLYDCIRELDDKINDISVDDKKLYEVENRLNLIRKILMKYDNKIDKALFELISKQERLKELNDYEKNKKMLKQKVFEKEKEVNEICEKMSLLRKNYADSFEKKLIFELKDLGFLDVKFKIDITKKDKPTEDGYDDCVFYISLNVGEKMLPISEVASGGELSRIMLSIKTILSNNYGKNCLIFDEVDQGISGITATKVGKKLKRISKNRQVICITHLPQIACMADSHYLITKQVDDNRTLTKVKELNYDESINEIGRLISSNENLTDKALANARELKEMAKKEFD